jgi:hypothetical protein
MTHSTQRGSDPRDSGLAATGIPLRDLHLVWPDLWPLLEPAVKRTPDKPDVLARLIARDAQLWGVYEEGKPVAAIVTTIVLCPEKKCRLWLVGGSRVREWVGDYLPKVEAWARGLGCTALWASGRDGWCRLANRLGFESVGTIAGFPVWERSL